jgi:hypothetical protein
MVAHAGVGVFLFSDSADEQKGQAVACPAFCALGPGGPKLVNGGTADPYRLKKEFLPSLQLQKCNNN